MATRPVSLDDERFNPCACRREVELAHGNGAVAESVAHDEEVMTTRLVCGTRETFVRR